jgi:hypothetical protein
VAEATTATAIKTPHPRRTFQVMRYDSRVGRVGRVVTSEV